MNHRTCVSTSALLSIMCFCAGIYFQSHSSWVENISANVELTLRGFGATFDEFGRLSTYPGKHQVACPKQDSKTAVLLLLGQSNAANSSNDASQPTRSTRVLNYYDGHCYLASSPLLGATNIGGEGWTQLGIALVESGRYEHVVLVPLAVGATPIIRWTRNNDLNNLLFEEVRKVSSDFKITHVLWHQGETDLTLGTTSSEYRAMFLNLVGTLREIGVFSPIYVSIASHCDADAHNRSNTGVAEAQRTLPDSSLGIFPGPDTDVWVSSAERYDGCHFSRLGIARFSAAWFEAISRN